MYDQLVVIGGEKKKTYTKMWVKCTESEWKDNGMRSIFFENMKWTITIRFFSLHFETPKFSKTMPMEKLFDIWVFVTVYVRKLNNRMKRKIQMKLNRRNINEFDKKKRISRSILAFKVYSLQ